MKAKIAQSSRWLQTNSIQIIGLMLLALLINFIFSGFLAVLILIWTSFYPDLAFAELSYFTAYGSFIACFTILFQMGLTADFCVQRYLGDNDLLHKIQDFPLLSSLFYSVLISLFMGIGTRILVYQSLPEHGNADWVLIPLAIGYLIVLPLMGLLLQVGVVFRQLGKPYALYNSFQHFGQNLGTYLLLFLLTILLHIPLILLNTTIDNTTVSLVIDLFYLTVCWPWLAGISVETIRAEQEEVAINHAIGKINLALTCAVLALSVGVFWAVDRHNQQRINDYIAVTRQEITQAQQTKYTRQGLETGSQPGNGAPLYNQLLAEEDDALYEDLKTITKDKTIQANQALPQKYRKLIDSLIQAGKTEYIQFKFDYTITAKLPNFIKAQQLNKLMIAEALSKFEQNQPDAGFKQLLQSLLFAQDLGHQDILISQMVGVAMVSDSLKYMSQQLTSENVKAIDDAKLAQELNHRLNYLPGLASALKTEKLTMSNTLIDLSHSDPLEVASVLDSPEQPRAPSGVRSLGAKWFAPYILQTMNLHEELWSEILKANPDITASMNLSPELLEKMERNIFMAIAMPNYQQFFDRHKRQAAFLAGMAVKLALHRYHLAHKAYPQTLSQLIPGYLPQMPLDPWTQKPLIYRPQKNGFSLYSVGPDRKDDGGTGALFYQGTHQDQKDLIFNN